MADTGLRYALTPIATAGQVIAKNEVRLSTDAAVTALPGLWGTIDTADANIPLGKFAWDRIRG